MSLSFSFDRSHISWPGTSEKTSYLGMWLWLNCSALERFSFHLSHWSSITDAGLIVLEGARCHFAVWQGSILRWRLHISAYDRMLPTLASWGLEVWGATGLFCPPFVPLSKMDLDTACFRGGGRGCNWFSSPLWFCLWLSGDGRVSAPRSRWIKWHLKFLARSRSTDRWSNLTSSAPDRRPARDG